MLIEFSVSNFRSFREKQTLSMVATPRLSKKRNVTKALVDGEKFPDLLKVAAIYGPNASGKSSLLQAMEVVCNLIRRVPNVNDYPLPVKPFRFDLALKEEPSRFEYNFIQQQMRYQFVIELTDKRVIYEKMISYPKGKESLLYERSFSDGKESYVFGEGLEGGKEVHKAWQRLTSPKALFISQAVANSSEDLTQLRKPFQWFNTGLLVIGQDAMRGWSRASMNVLNRVNDLTTELEGFLQEVDIPVSKIRLDEEEKSLLQADLETPEVSDYTERLENAVKLTHSSQLGEAEFEFSEESGGTKNLIGFWLPWSTMSLSQQYKSSVLAVDELDSSLHPEIVADLIEKHLESGIHAQLIFTTHDTHLMNAKILRRDQFWITERDANGATNLFSVHDFVGREGEDVEKRYFEGRYRGLPLIRRR
ncbi:ATP-binding protein [Pseudomonas sp. TH39(2020)]|uniref:AAA family ATPase n=1 Tax=Pseudomonas sp. TH39(2020) TaxID=2796349 RepID=UPI0019116DAD|nr:ATP-binding protein [Pseudomonas sp. TH39(2020)]MBK5399555.1 ATP-binding protein [Pseudomonas sp. TH39(2020)]